ncbi:MAG: cytochrome c biogenesis protein CcsA, partial [Planctomycetota bacterium]
DPVQRQILELANNLHDFEQLISTLSFARRTLRTDGSPALIEIYGPDRRPGLAHVIAGFAAVQEARDKFVQPLSGEDASQDYSALQSLFGEAMQMMAGGLACMPPDVDVETEPEWFTPSETVGYAMRDLGPLDRELRALGALEAMEQFKGDRQAFRSELLKLHTEVVAMTKARGEYCKIPLEVSFYKADYFTKALVFFLLGFLLVAVSWLVQPNRWLQLGIWLCTGTGAALVVAGITLRCIIRSRPPVLTLYDTIIFIAAACVLVAMFMEWINRQRIALALATMLGAGGMFLSMKYELKEAATAGDTMSSLVAVLDTNFWLATHVTTITLGYAAGLLASAIAHVWLLGKLFGLRKGDKTFYKSITRMVYGVVCFGLLLSVVGTILGGIWANMSWGRFWGWDPKENGALLICIWELMILHARMAGFIRDRGLAVMAVLGGLVVAFSWWGVNLLNIGLHSYGFTSGIFKVLAVVFAVEGLALLVSAGHWLFERGQLAAVAAVAVVPAAEDN